METISEWDMAEVLDTKDDIIACFEVAIADMDIDFLFETVSSLTRAKGTTQIAEELGVSREEFYKSLSLNENPSFEAVTKLFEMLGLQLRLERKSA